MVTDAKDKKCLKLGNWQMFFLEKLHQLYVKGTLCDVTLKFNDEQSIQAHKVVLTACTSFFDNLPSSSAGVVLHMPKNMKIQHVKPIINFMYTGKLEYAPEDQVNITYAAKHLGMNVLTELLQVQQQQLGASSFKTVDPNTIYKKYIHKYSPTAPVHVDHSGSNLPSSPVAEPASPVSSGALPGKKLPIWKKRTTITLPEEFYRSVNKQPQPPPTKEIPKPTRFEWPEEEVLPDVNMTQSFSVGSFEDLSYDSKIIVKPVNEPKPVIFEDSIDQMPVTRPVMVHGGKRARISEVVRERNDDDDDYDDTFETIHDLEDDVEDETTITTNIKPVNTTPKPILKTHEVSTPTPSKKVRFAFSLENGSSARSESQKPTPQPSMLHPPQVITTGVTLTPITSSTTQVTCPTSSPMVTATSTPSENHAKIIHQVLKKFPELVKNPKAKIKLKIQSGSYPPGSVAQSTVMFHNDGKGQKRVQYVVLKSDLTNDKKEIKNEVVMGAENRTGPWFCNSCANDKGPINFETYYIYRKHLQEVHNERIDARICEHCGFKASKRNLHLYHLYTKHNIPPPRNINFPKCDQCNYIALSESLLIKHRSNHTGMMSKEFVCRLCNAAFKSNGALMGHMQTNLHLLEQSPKKDYKCEYCGKIFDRNINLKAHIRTSHHQNRKIYDDEDRVDDPPEVEIIPEQRNQNVMEVIEVPVFDSVPGSDKTLFLPQGMTILAESPSVPLMPSSESEAMSNVATGIATSINITDRNIPNDVIVIDGHSELILRGTPATYVLNQDGTYSVQEYIVPEIMADSGQVYTTALVSSAPTTAISYVSTDNLPIITSATDHTYADGMKINGHVTTGAQVNMVSSNETTVIAPQPQVSQVSQPIIVQEPIIMSADWVQSITTSQAQSLNLGNGQNVEIISGSVSAMNNGSQVQCQVDNGGPSRTAQTLVSDWGDLEEDNQEDSQDGEDESDMKPSRPTIELDVSSEMDM